MFVRRLLVEQGDEGEEEWEGEAWEGEAWEGEEWESEEGRD